MSGLQGIAFGTCGDAFELAWMEAAKELTLCRQELRDAEGRFAAYGKGTMEGIERRRERLAKAEANFDRLDAERIPAGKATR
jgi:hypothetical protein